MNFTPVNRYLQVDIEESPNTTPSGVVLPDDYKPSPERHAEAVVRAWAPDVRFAEKLSDGQKVLIDRSMVEEITINNRTITVVLDNYVIGIYV